MEGFFLSTLGCLAQAEDRCAAVQASFAQERLRAEDLSSRVQDLDARLLDAKRLADDTTVELAFLTAQVALRAHALGHAHAHELAHAHAKVNALAHACTCINGPPGCDRCLAPIHHVLVLPASFETLMWRSHDLAYAWLKAKPPGSFCCRTMMLQSALFRLCRSMARA